MQAKDGFAQHQGGNTMKLKTMTATLLAAVFATTAVVTHIDMPYNAMADYSFLEDADFTGTATVADGLEEEKEDENLENDKVEDEESEDIITFEVHFNTMGGSAVESQEIILGEKALAPTDPVRAGYQFTGWYQDNECTQSWAFSGSVSQDMTLYAGWAATFDVVFDSCGGSTIFTQTVYASGTATEPLEPTRSGYSFWGWYTDETYETPWDFATEISSNVTLYAKWDYEQTYTVKFDTNGGTTVQNQTVVVNSLVTEPLSPVRTGYTFAGWYADKDYDERWMFEEDTITGNTTLYGKWSQNITSTVSGSVMDYTFSPIHEGKVSLLLGGVAVFETSIETGGAYYFNNVPTGTYNIKIEADNKTFIATVDIFSSLTHQDLGFVLMPQENVSTNLSISSTSNVSVVKNFDVVSAMIASEANAGESVTVQLNVSSYLSADAQVEFSEYKAEEEIILQYFQLSMNRRITSTLVPTSSAIKESEELLEIVVDLPQLYRGMDRYVVYRENDNEVQALTTKKNVYGEYISLSTDGKSLHIFTRNYCNYAIAFSDGDWYSRDTVHRVTLETVVNEVYTTNPSVGNVTISDFSPSYGTTVVISPVAKTGFVLDYVSAVDKNGNTVRLTENGDGTYQFTQGESNVSVSVAFVTTQAVEEAPSKTLFADVSTSDSYCDAVNNVVSLGLMSGTGASRFSPHESISRGMLVSILYNMSGQREVFVSTGFSDVNVTDYYGNAVAWATQNHIITGHSDGTFRPNDNITREQLAVIFYNYAERYTNLTSLVFTLPLETTDVNTVSGWASQAVNWSITTGVMSERFNNFFLPQAISTRAEVAVALSAMTGV